MKWIMQRKLKDKYYSEDVRATNNCEAIIKY